MLHIHLCLSLLQRLGGAKILTLILWALTYMVYFLQKHMYHCHALPRQLRSVQNK